TDNAKITRKWSKLEKHGHGNGKSAQEPEVSSKRYAITQDPIIYDSLVKQFWSTASLRASEERPPAIFASLIGSYTILNHCLETKLQLDERMYAGNQFGSKWPLPLICFTEGRRYLQMILESIGNNYAYFWVNNASPAHAAIAGTASGGAEDLDKLTALSSLVSTLVQKVNTQESEFKAHKLLFKEVVGKLVKKLAKAASKLLTASAVFRLGVSYAIKDFMHDLFGPDVNDDNFAERMVTLIAQRRRDFAAQRFQDKRNKPMTCAKQNGLYENFCVGNQSSHLYYRLDPESLVKKSLNIKRSLKRPGADLEQASSKKSKPTEAPQSSVPDESQQPLCERIGTEEAILWRKDSASDDDTPVNLHAVIDWELLPTGLGWVNVIYRKDNSRK
ncbi:hypothetical protein Tco_0591684, partial [Tanacetum coccineum]